MGNVKKKKMKRRNIKESGAMRTVKRTRGEEEEYLGEHKKPLSPTRKEAAALLPHQTLE